MKESGNCVSCPLYSDVCRSVDSKREAISDVRDRASHTRILVNNASMLINEAEVTEIGMSAEQKAAFAQVLARDGIDFTDESIDAAFADIGATELQWLMDELNEVAAIADSNDEGLSVAENALNETIAMLVSCEGPTKKRGYLLRKLLGRRSLDCSSFNKK